MAWCPWAWRTCEDHAVLGGGGWGETAGGASRAGRRGSHRGQEGTARTVRAPSPHPTAAGERKGNACARGRGVEDSSGPSAVREVTRCWRRHEVGGAAPRADAQGSRGQPRAEAAVCARARWGLTVTGLRAPDAT